MKYYLIIFIIFILFLNCTVAKADWTKTDTAYQITYSALHIIDWGQTRYIAKNSLTRSEMNPILGKHPSVGKVDTYFIGTLVGHTLISVLLPEKVYLLGLKIRPRRAWQGIWIIIETGYVAHNFGAGVKIAF